MDENELIKGFFVEDDRTFKTDQILNLIGRVGKYAKLVGKKGDVHIEDRSLLDADRSRLLLITRFLGAELAKLKPDLKIEDSIAEVNTDEFAKFLRKDKNNANARMSALVTEGFAQKPKPGIIKVKPAAIEKFIESLEARSQGKPSKVQTTQKGKQKSKKLKKSVVQKQIPPDFNEEQVYERLVKNLGVDEKILKDTFFFLEDGYFKFDGLPGKSNRAKQINCVLCTAYVLLIGFGQKTTKSTFLSKVAYESGVDTDGLNYTLRDMKNDEYITKAGVKSQSNILKSKGKKEALKILQQMCA